MKKKYILGLLALFGASLLFGSCSEDELIDYTEESNIYFMLQRWEAPNGITYNFKYPKEDGTIYQESWNYVKQTTDSIIASYALDITGAKYDTVYVPVSLLGFVSDYDRTFSYEIVPTTTAKEGDDFKILESKIPAKRNQGAIVIQIDRMAIKDRSEVIDFNLLSNNEFLTRYNKIEKSQSDSTQVSLLSFRVVVSDLLEAPKLWSVFQNWYGPFSRKKLYLIAELTGEPLDMFYSTTPVLATIISWAQMLKRHLLQQEKLGTPVMEEDGVTPMKVGPYA